ncbi:MAG: Na/Pi symporter [Candidatus Omnitrophica bacterium]|nr:Na/Pi symporter [Candidatus Omnitrophota bacterium]
MVKDKTSNDSLVRRVGKSIAIVFLLYTFLLSISLMSHAFKGFGKEFAETLISTTSNPFIAFFVGLLATSIIQSSGTVTSTIVAFVASGALSVRCAIPIIMGANIGTTVTNTLVALGHFSRREEFRRALSCSTIHDFFNLLTAAILLPIELSTHYLERTAGFFAARFCEISGMNVRNPLDFIIKPAIRTIDGIFIDAIHLPTKVASICMLIFALTTLFLSLIYGMKIMRSLIIERTETVLNNVLGKNATLVMLMGVFFTALVHSSSVTTSIMVPIVASGILTVDNAFPITLGANLGTTFTALIASLTGNVAAVTIALAHFIFNLTGILIFYPLKILRNIPLTMAKKMGEIAYKKPIYAFMYVVVVFFITPSILIFISRLLKW